MGVRIYLRISQMSRSLTYTIDLNQKNVQFIVDTEALEEKVRNNQDLNKYMGKPRLWPVRPVEGDDPRPHAPLNLVEPGFVHHAGFISENKKIGLLGFDYTYEPEEFLSTTGGKHLSQFPIIRHPAQHVRDGAGATGFPSDIWSLACLFGEIRTENEFFRGPRNYGLCVSKEEIEGYLKLGSHRVGFRIDSTQWDDVPDYSSDGADWLDDSDYSTNEDSMVAKTRDQTPSTVSDSLPEKPKEPESNKKKTEVPIERRITRSMTRMQQSNLSANDKTHMVDHNIVQPQEPSKKSKRSSRSSEDVQGEKTPTTIGQMEPKKKAPKRGVGSTEKDTPQSQEADVTESPSSQHQGKKPGASIVHSEEQEDALGKSTVTPASISEDTQKKGHRSDIIVKGAYQMPEDELSTMADLLGKMLDPDPENRPTIEEVLNHEWFGDRRSHIGVSGK